MHPLTPQLLEQLDQLACQYFQLVESDRLTFPPPSRLVRPQVQQYIYDTMFNASAVWPLPPVGYRSRVLKSLISKLETAIIDPDEDLAQEILDDLVASWGELISMPRRSPLEEAQKLSYIRYTAPKILGKSPRPSIVTSENRGLILSSGTTGFRTWEAAMHLGTFLSTPSGKTLVQGKNVIELGCGVGFLSMYCLKCLEANSIVATDMEQGLIDAIDDCIQKNELNSSRIKAGIWEWGNVLDPKLVPPSNEENAPSFDVAIGADLVYDPDIVPLLTSAIKYLFDTCKVKQFIISATVRNRETFSKFLTTCDQYNLNWNLVDFQSPPREQQDGLFHKTDVPIQTYRILPNASEP
ncbi:hypothetical protein KEM55_004925 [Ascosphaera atra]|nr:hypothetical protein KEM55_004925 [Ascosphaera atra]